MYKKVISLMAVLSMVALSFGGCGNKETKNTSSDAKVTVEATQEPTVEPTKEPTVEPTTEPTPEPTTYEEGKYIGFEDGVYGFIMLDTAPVDSDPATLEIADMNGSKALKVTTTEGKIPYVGIDASSLLGSNITKLKTMRMTVTAEYPDGTFYSVSGHTYAYSGVDRVKSNDNWAVYLDTATTKTVEATLDEGEEFVEGAKNLFIFAKETDNAALAGQTPVVLYFDNIEFLDADGNALPVDTSVSFDKPSGFGEDDRSNLVNVAGEVILEGTPGECNAWGQAVVLKTIKNDGGTFDPSILAPGCVLTVWYTSTTVPEVVLQSWSGGEGWAKVAPAYVNDSGCIAQFTYDDMVAAYKSEDFSTLDALNLGATEDAITVVAATVGKKAGEEVIIEGAEGSCGAWGQAVVLQAIKNEGGTFDPSILKAGVVVKVYYTGVLPEVILQSWSGGEGWAKVAPISDDGSVATFTYEDMVASYKSEDLSTLDAFNVGATDGDITVTAVSYMCTE